MATKASPQLNGGPKKPAAPRAPMKKSASRPPPAKSAGAHQKASPVANKAYSVAGDNPASGGTSAYSIMANRIANRVAEMAESITFVERYVNHTRSTNHPSSRY